MDTILEEFILTSPVYNVKMKHNLISPYVEFMYKYEQHTYQTNCLYNEANEPLCPIPKRIPTLNSLTV